METPEFLAWSLEFRCPLRGWLDGSDPERIERHLRAARATSDATRENRVLDGLAIDPPHGFRIADAMALYGGHDAARQACSACPANLSGPGTMAGCYGRVIVPEEAEFHACVTAAADRAQAKAGEERLCRTAPRRWYGLWIDSPLAGARAALIAEALAAAMIDERWRAQLDPLIAALRAAAGALRLHVAAYPRGSVEAGRWTVASHCPQCKVTWIDEGAGLCPVCGFVGRAAPQRARHAAGRRPYYPLDRLLGPQAAAELLVRYEASRAQPAPPDRQPDPPQPALPGSRPAG